MLNDKGTILRSPRSGISNSKTTDEATSGVVRNYETLGGNFQIPSPQLVSVSEDQYRSTIRQGEDTEYLLWAANTGSLRGSISETRNVASTIPTGTLEVSLVVNEFVSTLVRDGTRTIFLSSEEGSISTIVSLFVTRGDTGETEDITNSISFFPRNGRVTLTSEIKISILGGGFSRSRGDTIQATVRLSGPTFWWTKNDSFQTRFGWNGRLNRWAPLRGSSTQDLGILLPDSSFNLSPFPHGLSIGDTLPGDPNIPSSYSMVRAGSSPGEDSLPVRVLIREDDSSFGPNVDGVLLPDGTLVFSPSFIESHAGERVWFSPDEFVDSDFSVGPFGEDLFISPIPRRTEFPFIRIGSRTPLDVFPVENETLLNLLVVEEGSVGVSLSTGKLKFSSTDLSKIDPQSPSFDPGYLGAEVFFDGVSLTVDPVPLRSPSPLVGAGLLPEVVEKKNSLFIPRSRGNTSGTLFTLDKTGTIPNSSIQPSTRPNGCGLQRSIQGVGESVLFGKSKYIKTLTVVNSSSEVPKYRWNIPKGEAYLVLENGEVFLGKEDRKDLSGEQLYFLQSDVTASVFLSEAVIPSRIIGDITLKGTEVFRFRINENIYTWEASLNPGGVLTSLGGTFSPEEISLSLNSVITGNGSCFTERKRIFLRSDLSTNSLRFGEIEIGYGFDGSLDGNISLGFPPGVFIKILPSFEPSGFQRVPDSGVSLGLFRSPLNLEGTKPIPDVRSLGEYDDEVVFSSLSPNPVVLLQRSPLEDFPGYDWNVFFQTQLGLETRLLEPFVNLVGDFARGRFLWAEETTQTNTISFPTLDLPLEKVPAFFDSFLLPSHGVKVSFGAPFEDLIPDEDFLVESNSLVFTQKVGKFVTQGGRGEYSGNIFTDGSSDFSSILPGFQLDILEGTYIIEEVLSPTSLRVNPTFPGSGSEESWELFEGVSENTQDPGIIADVQYETFNHLTKDPFEVRVLSPLGSMPLGQGEQEDFRRVAILGDALSSQREFEVRVGEGSSSPTLTGRPLSKQNLGVLSNGSLQVPNSSSERFVNGDFSILVGGEKYSFSLGTLSKVQDFSSSLPGNLIEVKTSDGSLFFGDEVFTNLEGFEVLFVEEFLTPNLSPISLPQGLFEYSPFSGELNFSVFDMAEFGGTPIFLVELMNVNVGDLLVNPIQGSLLFSKPLRPLQKVEASYFLAVNGSGDLLLSDGKPTKIIEFLPREVFLEEASFSTPTRWTFNGEGFTVDNSLQPVIYIGSTLCNVGSSPEATIEGNVIVFKNPVDPSSRVRISYFVLECVGGEQTFSTTQSPVYRPPFRIQEDSSAFILEGDRTDLETGSLLRVAQFPFYITSTVYNPSEDYTVVSFIPETVTEAGSRDPSSNSLSLITDRPISGDSFPGFWEEISLPFEPVNRGFQNIIFSGDLTSIAVAGCVLEISGFPYLISNSNLIEGGRTEISITGVFFKGFSTENDPVRISVRPIYLSGSSTFLGRGALIGSEPFSLILFPKGEPGKTLLPTINYDLNFDTGEVTIKTETLESGGTLYLRQTKRSILSPTLVGDEIVNPRVISEYSFGSRPTLENGLLGSPLRAKYTFDNPDSFYFRTVSIPQFLGEVATKVAASSEANLPSSGSPPPGFSELRNHEYGREGLKGEVSNLKDEDRAARVFIEFFDSTIQSFEQILESITGSVIGDRDGKFRFFVGRDNDYIPPGFEDPISGEINSRNVFSELFFAINRNVIFQPTDPLVDPSSAILIGNEVQGKFMDPDLLDSLISSQREFVQNDIDDVVLVGKSKPKLSLVPLKLKSFGKFRSLSDPSSLSRIFPNSSVAFTLLDPGIESDLEASPPNPGVYSFSKTLGKASINGNNILPQRGSTFGKSIGEIGNPVLGNITNLSSILVEERRPRAVVFSYSPVGFPELDPQIILSGGIPFGGTPRPAVIATPLRIRDLPIDNSGLPDVSQLISNGGDLPDLTTGDPDLLTPPWETISEGFPKVLFGEPSGRVIEVSTGEKGSFEFPPGFPKEFLKGVYIKSVLLGCILTFSDEDGNEILSPLNIQENSPDESSTLGPFSPKMGDTIFIGPSNVNAFVGLDPNDPITTEQRETLLSGLPDYRVGFDLKVDRKNGEFIDITLPSFFDPSPLGLKETFGQRPPKPLSTLEATVTFTNSSVSPIEIPALFGGDLNDSGDRSIPYVGIPETEISLLGLASTKLGEVFLDTPEPGALFPNEILGVDGTIFEGVLSTGRDFLPGWTPGSGTASVRPFDFLFMETGQPLPGGSMGILSVGKVEKNSILPPRFVSPSQTGFRIRYLFENALGWVNQPLVPNPPGVVVRRVGNVTIFDSSSISTGFLVFNDGTPAVVSGGLNKIFNPGGALTYPNNGNILRINLFDPSTDTFLQTITVDINNGAPQITGDLGTFGLLSIPEATDTELRFETAAPFVTIGNGGSPELPEDPNVPGESLPLEFTIHVDTSSVSGGSFTGRIVEDRVTFQESFDLRNVPERFQGPIDGFDISGRLQVFTVTGSGTENLTVNNPSEVNGTLPFTFLYPGEFSSGVGMISVHGFEGWGNIPISGNDLPFSAAPSSDWDESSIIATGTGSAESSNSLSDADFRILNPSVSLSRVIPGDTVVITGDDSGLSSTKVGTYLVKHAVDPNVGTEYRSLNLVTNTNPVNTNVGFLQPRFPKLVSIDIDAVTVTVDFTALSDGSSSWGATGRLFFVRDIENISNTISLSYLSVDTSTNTFTILQGSGLDSAGNPVPDDEFRTLSLGTFLTGFIFAEVDFSKEDLPRNLVGNKGDGTFTFAAGGTGFGFRTVSISNVGAENFDYEIAPGGANNLIIGTPALDQLGISSSSPISNTSFVNDPDSIVYENVAFKMDFSGISTLQWQNIHGVLNVLGLFPGDVISATDFRAQGGIFLEPSVPRPVGNYNQFNTNVVDASHSLNPSQIGFRDGPTFGAVVTPELISFSVRRIRRFQNVLTNISETLEPLRFVYEIRRGEVTNYGPKEINGSIWPFVLEANGTTLGLFDDPKVNINPGDEFRLLSEDGTLLEKIFISAIQDGGTLVLSPPGLQTENVVGKSFEIFLKQAPVPHEQSNETLLESITHEVISHVKANYTTKSGGSVPVELDPFEPRRVFDENGDFSNVSVGDIVLIDPAGNVRGPSGIPTSGEERGVRPFGDRSVPTRTSPEAGQEIPFIPGSPSELDDNRGWYRVSEVGENFVKVSSQTEFSEDPGEGNVIFGDVIQYCVLPTVSGSFSPFASPPGGPGVEGQMDLRPTAFAGEAGSPTNSFKGNFFSIAPFSYTIFRPSPLFSEETIDLVLLMRERTLSFIEEFQTFFSGGKYGSYFVFQRDGHLSNLGNPLIPEEGLGVVSNELVNNVRGEVEISPFANTSDCLSVLDRRFWINDSRLDREFPSVGGPSFSALENSSNVPGAEDGDGRPVLPDLISEVLDSRDNLRQKRYFWIDFRVNRENGTLASISSKESQLDKRRKEYIQRISLSEDLES